MSFNRERTNKKSNKKSNKKTTRNQTTRKQEQQENKKIKQHDVLQTTSFTVGEAGTQECQLQENGEGFIIPSEDQAVLGAPVATVYFLSG